MLVKLEEAVLSLDDVLRLCRPSPPSVPRTNYVGFIGECAAELYLDELCKNSTVVIDNRTTLGRQWVLIDSATRKPLCRLDAGWDTLFDRNAMLLLGQLAAHGRAEVVLELKPLLTLEVEAEVLGYARRRMGIPIDSRVNGLSRTLIEALQRNPHAMREVLEASRYVASYVELLARSCSGRVFSPEFWLLGVQPDLVCVEASSEEKEVDVEFEVKIRVGSEEVSLGRASIPLRLVVLRPRRLKLIEVKSSAKARRPDDELLKDVRQRLEGYRKLGAPFEAYLLYVHYSLPTGQVEISLFRIA